MRTKEDLEGKEFREDLFELSRELVKQGITHFTLKPHHIVQIEYNVIEVLGYYPSGTFHLIVKNNKDEDQYSIIRGYTTFGDYEVMYIGKDKDHKFEQPERFTTIAKLITEILYK